MTYEPEHVRKWRLRAQFLREQARRPENAGTAATLLRNAHELEAKADLAEQGPSPAPDRGLLAG